MNIKIGLILATSIGLSACGGGGSSSGSGADNSGLYIGTNKVVYTHTVSRKETLQTARFTAEVKGKSITISDSRAVSTSTIEGDHFTAKLVLTPFKSLTGATCNGEVLYDGHISGITMFGDISGGFYTCRLNGNSATWKLSGTFSADKGTPSKEKQVLNHADLQPLNKPK